MQEPETYTKTVIDCDCCLGIIDFDCPVYRCSLCDNKICEDCANACESCGNTICTECSKELKDGGYVCSDCQDKYQESEFV